MSPVWSWELARRPFLPVRWRLALQLTAAGALTILITEGNVVISDGAAGVRASEIWGARLGTLYPGVHLVTPLVDSAAIYDTREQVYSTLAAENPKQKGEVLTVQSCRPQWKERDEHSHLVIKGRD